jgi:hypothetical protein
MQLPKFIAAIKKEHRELQTLVRREAIEAVISDNRYGCWSPSILSIIVTHQVNIRVPSALYALRGVVRALNLRAISRFDQCWIPDKSGPENLSGSLTDMKSMNGSKVTYVGNLSRFNVLAESEIVYDVAFILSGPEPQRTMLENIILTQVASTGLRYFIVRGIINGGRPLSGNVSYADFLPTRSMLNLIMRSKCVVARSGYSTIMDLAKLGKKAIFIPTPGQTEQEYLAARLTKMKIAYSIPQHLFNLEDAWAASIGFSGFPASLTRFDLLEESIMRNLKSLRAKEPLSSAQLHVKP